MILKLKNSSGRDDWRLIDNIKEINYESRFKDVQPETSEKVDMHRNFCSSRGEVMCVIYISKTDGIGEIILVDEEFYIINDSGKTIERVFPTMNDAAWEKRREEQNTPEKEINLEGKK